MAPTLSAILCNFNDVSLLPGAVEALLEQSFPPHEIILVDDGSTDGSPALIRRLADAHPSIKPIFLPRNTGVVSAGNTALRMASGSHVGWFAADDRILPGHFMRVAQALSLVGDAAVVASPVVLAMQDGSEKLHSLDFDIAAPHRLAPPALIQILQKRYLWLPSHAAFFRRNDLMMLGGWDVAIDWLSDWFALYALAMRGGVICLDEPGARIQERAGSFGQRRRNVYWHEAFHALFAVLAKPGNRDIQRAFAASPYLFTGPFGMAAAWEALRHTGGRSLGLRFLLWRLLVSRKLGFGHFPALARSVLPQA
ncbi:glycosyltransferase family 2 protein [Ferrovibrio sp.]|uniref:glycosyltransferase family 2 protein n=1 Tax=Ferrovibrio sp. TaxID=1917215 RepID=UPI0035B1A60B